jgi:hypothetical protein
VASAWAVAKAEAVCADSVWTDELVGRMAVALDEARAGEQRLRERVEKTAALASYHAKKLELEDGDEVSAAAHRGFARVLRSLLAEHEAEKAKEGR